MRNNRRPTAAAGSTRSPARPAVRVIRLGAAAVVLGGVLLAGQAPVGAAPAAPNGELLYKQRCQMCHGAAGKPATLAPSLAGVVGRKAGTSTFNYSAALKTSGVTWTRANLDKYLAAPTKFVPGTRMVVSVPDSKQRAALVTYLEKQR